jgi:hypothetical protein
MPEKVRKNLLGRTVTKSSGTTASGTDYKSREVVGPRVTKKTFKEYRKGSDEPFLTEKSRSTPTRSKNVRKDVSNPRKTFGYDSASDKKTKVVSTPSMVRRKVVSKAGEGKRNIEKTMISKKADVTARTRNLRIPSGKGRTKSGRSYQVEANSPNDQETRKYVLSNPVSQRAAFKKEVRKGKK